MREPGVEHGVEHGIELAKILYNSFGRSSSPNTKSNGQAVTPLVLYM